MKRFKAISMLLLAFVMVFTIAACGGKDEPKAQDPAPSNDPAPVEDEGQDTPDLKGETIRIVASWDDTPTPDDAVGERMVANLAAVKEKYNVNIEFEGVNWEEFQNKFVASMTSGQPIGDLIYVQMSWILPSMVKKGLIVPINDYIDLDKDHVIDKPYKTRVGVFQGKSYGFGTKITQGMGIYYNRTLVGKLGLTDPQEYVKAGTWDWDQFLQFSKDATRDDGTTKTWGLSASIDELGQLLVSSNGAMIVDENAGKEGYSDPKTIEALEFLNKLYHVDQVVRYDDIWSWEEPRKLFTEGSVVMTPGHMWEGANRQSDMGDTDWGFLPFPKGPQASGYIHGVGDTGMWVIPTGTKVSPDMLLKIWTEFKDYVDVEEYPGQGEFERVFLTEGDIESARIVTDTLIIQNYNGYADWTYDFSFSSLVGEILANKTPVATAVEQMKQQMQAKIDEVLK